LKADKGIECYEASAINFKNIRLVTKQTSPVINVVNSDKIVFNNIGYNDYAELLLQLSGDKTKDIKLVNTDMLNLKQLAVFNAGADKSALVKE